SRKLAWCFSEELHDPRKEPFRSNSTIGTHRSWGVAFFELLHERGRLVPARRRFGGYYYWRDAVAAIVRALHWILRTPGRRFHHSKSRLGAPRLRILRSRSDSFPNYALVLGRGQFVRFPDGFPGLLPLRRLGLRGHPLAAFSSSLLVAWMRV